MTADHDNEDDVIHDDQYLTRPLTESSNVGYKTMQ